MKSMCKIIILALFFMQGIAFASTTRPSDLDDTIPATPRCDKYYYTKWFDDCPNWRPNGVWDSCFVSSIILRGIWKVRVLPSGNMHIIDV